MEQAGFAGPLFDDGQAGRLAVDVHQHRILLRRVEVARLDHPSVEFDVVGDFHFEEVRLGGVNGLGFFGELVIVFQRSQRLVVGKADDLDARRADEAGEGWEAQAAVGSDVGCVQPRRPGSNAFGRG